MAWGVTTALSLHFASYFWRITTYDMFLYGLGNGIGIFFGLDFWRRMAERFDKKPVFITGLVIYVVFLSGGTFLKLLGWWPAWGTAAYVPTFVLTVGLAAHFGLSATMATGGSMMADVTDEDQLRQGRRREGIFFAAVSFTQKASFGIGSLLAGLVVAFVGLEANLDPADAAPDVANTLGLTLGMRIIFMGSAPFIRPGQMNTSIFVQLGNGRNFVFDIGEGSPANYVAAGCRAERDSRMSSSPTSTWTTSAACPTCGCSAPGRAAGTTAHRLRARPVARPSTARRRWSKA